MQIIYIPYLHSTGSNGGLNNQFFDRHEGKIFRRVQYEVFQKFSKVGQQGANKHFSGSVRNYPGTIGENPEKKRYNGISI